MTDNPWIKLQSARNIGEATLIKNALENEDLEVKFRGEHRPSIAGELPFPEAEIEILVREEDLATARAVLERATRNANAPPRTCPSCGEENPGNFESCWKCQTAFER